MGVGGRGRERERVAFGHLSSSEFGAGRLISIDLRSTDSYCFSLFFQLCLIQ